MKSSKKALAFALAAAMAITGIPVTNAGAATTTAKLGATKATIYAGNSKYISVSTPSSWKRVKLSVSSSRTSVASVKKNNAKKKIRVDAVKAGTAKVTVKVTAKKSGKTVKKTLSANITVKDYKVRLVDAAGTTVSNTTIDTTVGTAVKLTAKTAPANDKVTFTSDNESVATVDASGNVTPVKAGTVTITAASAKATDKVTINVADNGEKPEVVADGITAEVSNCYNGIANVVLVNQAATIKVQVYKDNKPVANKKINFALGDPEKGVNSEVTDKTYDIIGDKTQTTDANGCVTFTVANVKNSSIKATDGKYAASFAYTITTDDGTKIQKPLGFASIGYGTVENCNKFNEVQKYGVKALEPALNDNGGDGLTTTNATMSKVSNKVTGADVDYVDSQQVSTNGEHKVKFGNFQPMLNIVAKGVSDTTSKGIYFKDEKVAYTSGKYGTANRMIESGKTNPYTFKLGRKPSELTYATLHFGTISLSKYTNLTINTYKIVNGERAKTNGVVAPVDTQIIEGDKTLNNQTYSIPLKQTDSADDLEIEIILKSADQVNLNQNDGYSLAYVDGVYQDSTSQGEAVKSISLTNLKVNWDYNNTDAQYNTEQKFITNTDRTLYKDATGRDVTAIISTRIPNHDQYTITYQVPSFPAVGNAIIRCYNKNNKIAKYFVWPTRNGGNAAGVNPDKYTNVNVLDTNADYCYEVSETEATTRVGEKENLITDGNSVTVDSKFVGVTFLKGTITDANGNIPEGFDDTNKDIYTFVQWCPVKGQTGSTPSTGKVTKGYLALTGQMIDITAQLCDVNGNPVATEGQKIKFDYDKNNSNVTNLTREEGKTDKNGRVTLTLQSAKATTLTGVTATNDIYKNVKVFVGPSTTVDFTKTDNATEVADLYWVDANLKFDANANNNQGDAQTESGKDIATAGTDDNAALQPSVGQEWEYRIGTAPGTISGGTLVPAGKSYDVIIDGLKLKYETSGTGSFAVNDGLNVVTAKSEQSGKFEILGKVDNTSLTNSTITFTVNGQKYDCVGSGNTNLNKRLTLKGAWQAEGETIQLIAPNGTASADDTITLYAKVADQHANVMKNQPVQVAFSDNISKVEVNGSDITVTKVANTDANGLVKLTVTKKTGTTVTNSVVAVSDKTDATVKASVNISWVTGKGETFSELNTTEKNADGSYKSNVSADGKKVILTFNDKISKESVIAKEFTVAIGEASDEYGVSDVNVNGKEVILTINNGPSTIKKGAKFVVSVKEAKDKDGIAHTMTDEFGRTIAANRTFTLTFDGGVDEKPVDSVYQP